MSISDYSTTPSSNASINGINIAEGCPPSGINNAIRQLMADLKTAQGDGSMVTDSSVTTAKIVDANVTAAKLAVNSVETAKIKDAAVTTAKIGAEAVETSNVKDGAITAAKLAAGAVAKLPVGSLYFNASNGTNPATLLGYGTWSAFGQGRVILGVGTGTDGNSDTLAVTAGATGGEYRHTNTIPEIPEHSHNSLGGTGTNYRASWAATGSTDTGVELTSSVGGGQPHNNIQPYIGVYVWKRTA